MNDNNTNNINTEDIPADIAFLQYALPPLKSGNFTVTVTQQVSVNDTMVDNFQASQAFYVAGERYSLKAADVNSVFPPMGNQGEFSNNLAHVVFNIPTLPWQRSPNPTNTAPVAGQPVATWLGVLLFDQNDPPPKPKMVTLADLNQPPTGIFFPQRVAEDGENSTDPVTVIDIPIALFNAIAPSLADLNWTAHVRTVDPSAKAGNTVPALDYSVVFGNRLPVPGNHSTAHLVSFEDFGPYLPADDGVPNTAIPNSTTVVRMVTLQNWTFTALDLKQTFAGLLTQVSLNPSTLQLPYNSANTTGNAMADNTVQNAFGMGYTAMNHGLRDGSLTVSWYRGPFLPLTAPVTSKSPWTDADQLQRYDPTTGMFDVSYSSAWQLGRLLALHDGAFAAALYRWKLTQTQAQVATLEQQVIDQELPPISSSDAASGWADASSATNLRHARMRTVIKGLAGPVAAILRSTNTKE